MNGEDLTIEFDGETKFFPVETLSKQLANCNGEIHTSKFNNKKYSLIEFPWTTSNY